MNNKSLIIVADYSQDALLTSDEICLLCGLSHDDLNAFLNYGIIYPIKFSTSNELHFNLAHFQRIKRALRLQKDLEMNLAGVALVLDLLDEMEKLRSNVHLIEKHYLR